MAWRFGEAGHDPATVTSGELSLSMITTAGDEPWHSLSVAVVVARLETRTTGLDESEAARRLERFGPNALRTARPVSAWRILIDQFRSIVVLLLLAAAAVAWFV